MIGTMAESDLRNLLERAQTWPEEAQKELVAIASEIENELLGGEYLATQEELRSIDAALASIDRGELATDAEVAEVFAKFRRR
jgi:predicted transcriptional regulator